MRAALTALLLVACGSSSEEPRAASKLAAGLHVSDVSLYQAVEVPFAVAGQAVTSSVPVVAGRKALLRVGIEPESGWVPRDVTAHLELSGLPAMEATLTVTGASTASDLATSFDFELPGETLSEDRAFRVSLVDSEPGKHGKASPGARFPASGALAPFAAKSTGSALKLVIVPVVYAADGSNRLPDLGDAELALYREKLVTLYPARDVEFRIHDSITWSTPVHADGNGWGDLLNELLFLRQEERLANQAAPDEYYYALFQPAPDMAAYCSSGLGCLLGLSSTATDPADEFFRGSVGAGFSGDRAAFTLAHETGHAHGRMHAPCAPGGVIQAVDPNYPHPDAELGAWGYDIDAKTLIDPAGPARDLMSYCDPTWVSDYTYTGLFERMAFVSQSAASSNPDGGSTSPYFLVSVDGEGRVGRVRAVLMPEPLVGEHRRVDAFDSGGKWRRSFDVPYHPYSDLPGGLLLVPAPDPGDAALVFRGQKLPL